MKEHFEWFNGVDEILAENERLMAELKEAVEVRGLPPVEAEQVMADFHAKYPTGGWDVI